MNFLLSVEYNSCSGIHSLRNKVKLFPPFLQEAEGSTVVTILAMWSCGSEKSMISLIFPLPCLSVCILTALEDTHSLCLSRSVLTLLPHDQLLFDLSTQMSHRQIKSRSDLSVFVPKVFLSRLFSFISAKAHTTQSSTASGFSLPFPQTCHETEQQTH